MPVATADLSVRLVGDQRSEEIARNLEELLRGALPDGAELIFSAERAEPSSFDPESPVLQAARRALAKATGREPALVRSGGTLPILAAFAERGIPAIVSGFSLPDDGLHAPDESYRLVALEQGQKAARGALRGAGRAQVSPEGDELEQLLEALRALPKSERRAAALLASDSFQRAVELLGARSDEALLALAGAEDAIAGAAAFEALRRRPADQALGPMLLALIARIRGQRVVFLLRALDRHVEHRADRRRARCAPGAAAGWGRRWRT